MKNLVVIFMLLMIFKTNHLAFQDVKQEGLNATSTTKFSQIDLLSMYQFEIGKRLSVLISNKCTLFYGTIQNIQDNKVNVLVQDFLYGDTNINNQVQLAYFRPNSTSLNDSIWAFVDMQVGKRLLISSCGKGEQQFFNLIVSKEEFFPIIQNIIAFNKQLNENRKLILDVPRIVNQEKTLIFAGYIVSVLRGFYIYEGTQDDSALVLTQLLENPNLASFGSGFIMSSLRNLISNGNEGGLSPSARDLAISRIIDVGSGDNKTVPYAISLLVSLAENGKINIRNYLNEEKRQRLVQNYQNLAPKNLSQKGKMEFERQLLVN